MTILEIKIKIVELKIRQVSSRVQFGKKGGQQG